MRKYDLKISIRLALHSLGRLAGAKMDRMTVAQLEAILQRLRREQIERGIHTCEVERVG